MPPGELGSFCAFGPRPASPKPRPAGVAGNWLRFARSIADWNAGMVEYWNDGAFDGRDGRDWLCFAHFVAWQPVRYGMAGRSRQVRPQSAIRNPKSAIDELALFRTMAPGPRPRGLAAPAWPGIGFVFPVLFAGPIGRNSFPANHLPFALPWPKLGLFGAFALRSSPPSCHPDTPALPSFGLLPEAGHRGDVAESAWQGRGRRGEGRGMAARPRRARLSLFCAVAPRPTSLWPRPSRRSRELGLFRTDLHQRGTEVRERPPTRGKEIQPRNLALSVAERDAKYAKGTPNRHPFSHCYLSESCFLRANFWE